jgi:hypothetical protein
MDALLRLWPCAWQRSFADSRRYADRALRRIGGWWWEGIGSQGRRCLDESEALDRIRVRHTWL